MAESEVDAMWSDVGCDDDKAEPHHLRTLTLHEPPQPMKECNSQRYKDTDNIICRLYVDRVRVVEVKVYRFLFIDTCKLRF